MLLAGTSWNTHDDLAISDVIDDDRTRSHHAPLSDLDPWEDRCSSADNGVVANSNLPTQRYPRADLAILADPAVVTHRAA